MAFKEGHVFCPHAVNAKAYKMKIWINIEFGFHCLSNLIDFYFVKTCTSKRNNKNMLLVKFTNVMIDYVRCCIECHDT